MELKLMLNCFSLGGWTRGAKVDFDDWAELAHDTRWNYDSLLPYFKETENFWSNVTNYEQQVTRGPWKSRSLQLLAESTLCAMLSLLHSKPQALRLFPGLMPMLATISVLAKFQR